MAAAMAVGLLLRARALARRPVARLCRASAADPGASAGRGRLVSPFVYSSSPRIARMTDSILAYGTYFGGREGGIHAHPWHYYLQLLAANRPARLFLERGTDRQPGW